VNAVVVKDALKLIEPAAERRAECESRNCRRPCVDQTLYILGGIIVSIDIHRNPLRLASADQLC
jgi:hypothetical protein